MVPALRRAIPLSRRLGLGRLTGLAGLDPGTLEQYAQNAGFTGADLLTAVAIALAESGGNPNDYNPETAARGGTPTGKGSYGLWQIYLNKHPEFAGWNLYDPQTNANAAFSIYSAAGNSFQPWSTYTGGQYQAFLTQVPNLTPAAAPLTIDASTGQPVDDSTDADALQTVASSVLPGLPSSIAGIPTGSILLLTAVAAGAYLLADSLSD
jgi:Lysozyme like domain